MRKIVALACCVIVALTCSWGHAANLDGIVYNEKIEAVVAKFTGVLQQAPAVHRVVIDPSVNYNVKFGVVSQGKPVSLQIKTANGTEINRQSAYDTGVPQPSDPQSIRVQASLGGVGEWTITVTPQEGSGETNYVLVVYGDGENNTYFHLTTDRKAVAKGGSVMVLGSCRGNNGVKGIEISGAVIRPDGVRVPLALYDDGQAEHADQYAGDGNYTNTFSRMDIAGKYRFEMDAHNEHGMTVVPGDSPDFVEMDAIRPQLSQRVAPFMRHAEITVDVQ